MIKHVVISSLILLLVLFWRCFGETSHLRRILERRDPLSPPLVNGSYRNAVDVSVSFGLVSLNGINERSQTLAMSYYVILAWRDSALQWTPDDKYPDFYYAPNRHIWRPRLVTNEVVAGSMSQVDDDDGMSSLSSDGGFISSTFLFSEMSCAMDFSKFPFDTQTCNITFSINFSHIKLKVNEKVWLNFTNDNNEWDILGLTFRPYENVIGGARATLTIKRRPLFHVLKSVLPSILLSFVNVCVFLLPAESGERMTMSISSFLAYAIYVTYIYESLPANSGTVASFPVYLCTMMLQSGLIILATLISLRLHHTELSSENCLSREIDYQNNTDVSSKAPKGQRRMKMFDFTCFIVMFFITFCSMITLLVQLV